MLTEHVERYLTLRRALGFELRDASRNLRAFARFGAARGDTHVRSTAAVEWAAEAPSPKSRHVRLRDVVLLARFLNAEDERHEVPPVRFFHAPTTRVPPYIYTPDEVGRFLEAAGRIRRHYPLRRQVYVTLIGLIATTGLRVSEALDLRFDDVFPDSVLRICKTKFGKSRLVPLHPTTAEALSAYLEARQRLAIPDDHVFVSASNRRIAASTVNHTFRRMLRLAGIAPGRDRRPRIHDLRHTFATRSLEQCATRREPVSRHLVALSTYLGHADVAHTYWYLEATPELMVDIAAAGEILVAWSSR